MRTHTVIGGGGIRLHVEETGNAQSRPIVFLHGFSQSRLSWRRQMNSDLANDFRLVAMDLRGHGLSEKPHDAYGDSKLWADDVQAVIETLGLDRPVLSGWSYGGLIICDYLRHHGEGRIGGINLVGAVSKLGTDAAFAVLAPRFLAIVPGFFSSDVEESVGCLAQLVRLFMHEEPSPEDFYGILGYNVIVPPPCPPGVVIPHPG